MASSAEVQVQVFEFDCEIYKVQSLSNGTFRITLDCPEYAAETIAQFMKAIPDNSLYKAALVREQLQNKE